MYTSSFLQLLSAAACVFLLPGIADAADTGCRKAPTQKWPLLNNTVVPAPKYVFRGDSRSWQAIRDAGGWLPYSIDHITPRAFGVYNHEKDIKFAAGKRDTVYVSTTTTFDVAVRYALLNGADTYVYYIHAAPNMFDMNRSLGNESKFWWQSEYPAMGGIHWSQVVGWVHIDKAFRKKYKSYTVPDCGKEDYANTFFHRLPLIRNGAYDTRRWSKYAASGPQPQLAGFSEYAGEFAKKGYWYEKVQPWSRFLDPSLNRTTEEYALEFMDKTKASRNFGAL
ncbi:putative enterotoxin [Cordyceps sp. RAO-2017]|nr:putative enterotoxin [Cordyceps sp. RAO-2017]